MRKFLEHYNKIFVDIDDTLIYGWFTVFMHYEWMLLRNNFISALAMKIQNIFNLYKVNRKLMYMLKPIPSKFSDEHIIFLTVRAKSKDTEKMINKIMNVCNSNYSFEVVALGSDNGHEDKARYIYENYGDEKCLLIDDNKLNRDTAEKYGIDTFDPKLLREEFIG